MWSNIFSDKECAEIKLKLLNLNDLYCKDECIKCKLTDCVEVCPAIVFMRENIYINPDECIDYGVCEPGCPIDAIKTDTDESMQDKEKWLLQTKVFCNMA